MCKPKTVTARTLTAAKPVNRMLWHVTRETVYRLPIGDAPKRMALMACLVSLNYWRIAIRQIILRYGSEFLLGYRDTQPPNQGAGWWHARGGGD
jgi:hypothetical protein